MILPFMSPKKDKSSGFFNENILPQYTSDRGGDSLTITRLEKCMTVFISLSPVFMLDCKITKPKKMPVNYEIETN